MALINCNCLFCRKPMMVREADVKRGWGKFCSKRCKAKEQEARTGQYATLLRNGGPIGDGPYGPFIERDMYDNSGHVNPEDVRRMISAAKKIYGHGLPALPVIMATDGENWCDPRSDDNF